MSNFAMCLRPFPCFYRALRYGDERLAIQLEASVRRRVNVFAHDLRRMVCRHFNEFVVLIHGLVSPRSVRHLTNFGKRNTSVLPKGANAILSQRITLRCLSILTNGQYLVVIIPGRTDQLRTICRNVLPKRLPIGVQVLILIPPTVGPGNACFSVVNRRLNRLIIRRFVMTIPITLQVQSSHSASNTSP